VLHGKQAVEFARSSNGLYGAEIKSILNGDHLP